VVNLIDDPAHADRIADLRQHLEDWMAATGDLGLVLPETKLVREAIWPPDGIQPATPAAEIDDRAVQQGDGMVFVVTLTCVDPGASIGYRQSDRKKYVGPWTVYTGPFEVPADRRFLEVQTHRIGHTPTTTGAFLGGE
jgi:N-sulfoglucosamine sulfohydrolase